MDFGTRGRRRSILPVGHLITSSMIPKLIGLFLVLYEVEYFWSRSVIHTYMDSEEASSITACFRVLELQCFEMDGFKSFASKLLMYYSSV